jgi:hypothetical protein
MNTGLHFHEAMPAPHLLDLSGLKKLEVAMEHAAVEDYVKIPKQEYNLLKEVYRTVKRQAFLVRIDEAERNLAAGKTKSMTVEDFIASV